MKKDRVTCVCCAGAALVIAALLMWGIATWLDIRRVAADEIKKKAAQNRPMVRIKATNAKIESVTGPVAYADASYTYAFLPDGESAKVVVVRPTGKQWYSVNVGVKDSLWRRVTADTGKVTAPKPKATVKLLVRIRISKSTQTPPSASIIRQD